MVDKNSLLFQYKQHKSKTIWVN